MWRVVSAGQLYGLEKFWAFLKYSRRNVEVEGELKEALKKYNRLEDFRVEVSLTAFSISREMMCADDYKLHYCCSHPEPAVLSVNL